MTEPSDPVVLDTPAAPKRRPFRNKFTAPRLSPDSAERQGKIALLAWNLLGGDQALAFLNNHDEGLGGRPLDLATAGTAGFAAVERAISARVTANEDPTARSGRTDDPTAGCS